MSLRMVTSVAIGLAIVQSGIAIIPDPPLQWLLLVLWSVLFVTIARLAWHRMTRDAQHRTVRTLARLPRWIGDVLDQPDQPKQQ